MKKITIGYLCIVLLGISNWPTPASAQGGANPGPTCDEITSSYVCSIPEVLVTAPRNFWFHGWYWQSILGQLNNRQLSEFINAATKAILQSLPDEYRTGLQAVSSGHVRNRQRMAQKIVDTRETFAELQAWVDDNAPSCHDLTVWAQAAGLIVVTGAALPPVSFPGVVVGVIISSGSMLTQHFAC